MSIPNAQQRDNVWFFRRRVPADLKLHYPHAYLLKSLGTSDYETAKVRAAIMTASTNAEFALLRGETPDDWQAPSTRSADFYLSRDELENAEGWEQEYAANREHHEAVNAALRDARESTDKILIAAGMPTVEQLALSQFLATVEPRPNAPANSAAEVPDATKTLRHVVPSWITRKRAKENAIDRTNKALDLFEEACGIVPVKKLTKAHGARFVLFLLDSDKRGFASKTAGNHAACITALMNVAVKDDLIDRNPFDLAIDKNADAKTRKPRTDAELRLMYGSPLFSDRMDTIPEWEAVTPTDGRALLLILQHTGARIGEIAQLRRGDFLTLDGITCIHITPDAGTTKTKESERTVPLADHLRCDPWFASWLTGIMNGIQPDASALPSMTGRSRGPSDTAGRWFNEFRKVTKLPPGQLEGSHKFRHWLRSSLAAKGVGDATADSITGHAAEGSSGRVVYTAAASMPVMLEALNRIAYPQLSR